jgi:hypothetical protein
MTDLATLVNPFRTWAELTRGLHDRFLAELKISANPERLDMTPHCGDFVGSLAALITQFDHLDIRLHGMVRHDPRAFEAFARALEKS